ncbi:MAG TPA: 5-oxoprolinase subunit PxpA [Burkholderiaceae bacterium]
MHIDLNADLGEGMGDDDAILACVSSANIACGGHAGDAASMRQAVRAAKALGVAIGAHPSYDDRANFGRTDLHLPSAEVTHLVTSQVAALRAIAQEEGARVVHVKPHGALYNQAARDPELADAILAGVRGVDPALAVMGLAGGQLTARARDAGMTAIEEAFADRAYLDDGSLAPRSLPGAVLDDIDAAVTQTLAMLRDGRVRSLSGAMVAVRAVTVCLHGDGAHAIELARTLRAALSNAGIAIRSPFPA